jgi:pteridine reductase
MSAAEASRVALVTGGARRLGAAMVREMAARGYLVALHYRSSGEQARQLAEELRSTGGVAELFEADLSNAEAPARLVAEVARRCGRLDVVVNSAASFERTPIGEVTPAQWDAILGTNLRAPFFIARAAAPLMNATGGGVIVNMADLAAFETWPAYLPHALSKGGVVQLTRALARLLAPTIRVNAIAPGAVLLPDDWESLPAMRLAETTPLGRVGDPDDVVRALAYLLDATYVTGEVLMVDGGRNVRR